MTEPSEKEVEAVARAICAAEGMNPDYSFVDANNMPHRQWTLSIHKARAAIAAYEKEKADEYMRNTMS